VRSAAQVKSLRAAANYAPEGNRSISLSHPQAGYGAMTLSDYLTQQASRRPLLVAQIETVETDDALGDIVSAGADVIFLGLTDLSVDAGQDAARVRARVEEVAEAAGLAGVPLGAFGLDDPRVSYELVSSDVSLLRAAVADVA
jgi:4-hydroxy-2-oxoheptanedioate aldolase